MSTPVSALPPRRVVHIIRMRTAGGGVLAPLRIAAAERSGGRAVHVDALIAEDFTSVVAMAQRSGVDVHRVGILRLAWRLALIRVVHRPDVVHLHSGMDMLSANVRAIRRALPPAVPLIVWLHGSGELANADEAQRQEHARTAREISAVVVPSSSQLDAQVAAGLDPGSVYVVPAIVPPPAIARGASRARLGISARAHVVFFCGRMIPSKNPLLTVDAFRACTDRDAVLVMAGGGPLLDEVRTAASDLGDRVRVLGHVDDVEGLYADADLFVSPSTTESFGLTAIEALRSGVACALSRIRPWSDHFVDGRDVDFFAADATAGEIAAVLDRLLLDEHLRRSRAAPGGTRVERQFGASAALAALDLVYADVLRGRRRQRGKGTVAPRVE